MTRSRLLIQALLLIGLVLVFVRSGLILTALFIFIEVIASNAKECVSNYFSCNQTFINFSRKFFSSINVCVLVLLITESLLGIAGFVILITGFVLNYLAVVSNKLRMPITRERPLTFESSFTHAHINEQTRFKFLCDIYQSPYEAFSIGDVLIVLGMFTASFG